MPTLGDLIRKFDTEVGAKTAAAQPPDIDAQLNAALEGGSTKTASTGGNMTLQDILLQMYDIDKTASAAAISPSVGSAEPTEEEMAAAAEKLAADEAEAQLEAEAQVEPSEQEILKMAAEYDAAGRIMFRAFLDESIKLAGGGHTEAAPNRHTETESAAKTPALGNRGLPTLETNYVGSPNHDQPTSMKGGKDVYRDSLATSKKIRAGVTGDDPEAAAIALGGGAPMGFATVRDLLGA